MPYILYISLYALDHFANPICEVSFGIWLVIGISNSTLAIGIFLYMTLNAFYAGVREFVADVKKDGSVDQLDAGEAPV